MASNFQNGRVAFESSKDGASDEQQGSTTTNYKMGSMMSSVHNEYSDLEDESSEETFEETEPANVPQASDADDYKDVSGKYTRYGIGAKLMMKMGYQQGKGLGSDQSGIVNPIESVGTKGRAGIGSAKQTVTDKGSAAVAAAATGTKAALVSDEESDMDDAETKEMGRLKLKVFDILLKLEKFGLELPGHLSNWAQGLRQGVPTLLDPIENTYRQLKDIYENMMVLDQRQKSMDFELSQSYDLETEIEDEISQLEATQNLFRDIDVDKFSESLSLSSSSSTSIIDKSWLQQISLFKDSSMIKSDLQESAFLSLVQSKLASLLSVDLADLEMQESVVIPALHELSRYFLSTHAQRGGSPAQLDLYLLKYYSDSFKKLITSTREAHGDQTCDQVMVAILSLWSSLPVFVDMDGALYWLLQEIFANRMAWYIDAWDPHSTHILDIIVMDYLTVFSRQTGAQLSRVYNALTAKIHGYLDHDSTNSMWFELKSATKLRDTRTQLELIFNILLPQIAVHNSKSQSASLASLAEKSLVSWISESNLDDEFTFDVLLTVCQAAKFKSSLRILQYMVFNKWLQIAVQLHANQTDPTRIPRWFSKWYSYFTQKSAIMDDDDDVFEEVVTWYLAKALKMIQSNFDSNECQSLPRLNGEILPTPDQFFHFDHASTPDASGLASDQLMVTFKDMVDDFCFDHGISVTSLRGRFHETKGFPIMEFARGQGRPIHAYINDEVLWICSSSGDPERGDYEPIDFTTLSDIV
ncbi:uncharacterized protein LODBEIA_P29040 [Lodderomyces beijingensis]|uniref:G-patch domain-containing protein n=1 Tax=Lodderomyces beijingensis TaxID=1775926 RepID=A0ABP0ZKL2_9ASCO